MSYMVASFLLRALVGQMFKLAHPLGGVSWTVLNIPGDAQLRPIEDDWTAEADRSGDSCIAVCAMIHAMVSEGVTSEGQWTGPARDTFEAAEADVASHEHPEAFVVLASLNEGV
jgi:hypothetical protein